VTVAGRQGTDAKRAPGGDLNVIHASALVCVCDRGGPRRGAEQGGLDLIADGAVAVRDGVIVAVGTSAEIVREWAQDGTPTIDARGRTVMPGLVESHCHPLFKAAGHPAHAECLPLAEIAGREDGIWATVLETREASAQELLAQLATVYARALAGGVTTLEVKSGYSLNVEGELRDLRLLRESRELTPLHLVSTFLGAHMVPADETDADAYMESVVSEMLPQVAADGLAEFADVSCDAGLFDPHLVAKLLERAAALGIPTRVHADGWAAAEGWQTAAHHGAVAADHLTFTPDDEIAEVGACETIATLLPLAELIYMTERRANARAFIDAGVPVAIATDYCSSLGSSSLATTIGIAAPWFAITPAEAIVGATLNAAYSLRLGSDRGSLDVGKRGDLTVLDVPHPNDVYLAAGRPLVAGVVIAGNPAWQAG
jgi:imidazolonepropionase